jgi:hypothetical protein
VLVVAVQQVAFLAVLVARRRSGAPVRGLLLGWGATVAAIGLLLAPLAPFALDQFAANEASGRGFDRSPSQAGADVSAERARPGVYGVLTNALWAVWGYHSNATMTALTALWPVVMLLCFVLLGRVRRGGGVLVAACGLVPVAALLVLGMVKPFLFEVRYFIALVPMALLLLARAATGWPVTRTGAALATAVVAATLALGTVDQQVNRSNPRLYDFEGALAAVDRRAQPGDVLLYEPGYLRDLIAYHDPAVPARPLEAGIPREARRVFLLGSFLDLAQHDRATAAGLERLAADRRLVAHVRKPQVKVWLYR